MVSFSYSINIHSTISDFYHNEITVWNRTSFDTMYNINYELFRPSSLRIEPDITIFGASFYNQTDNM